MILGKEHILEAIENGDIIADGVPLENIGTNSIDVTLGDELFEVIPNTEMKNSEGDFYSVLIDMEKKI